jgi:hypothetical protein
MGVITACLSRRRCRSTCRGCVTGSGTDRGRPRRLSHAAAGARAPRRDRKPDGRQTASPAVNGAADDRRYRPSRARSDPGAQAVAAARSGNWLSAAGILVPLDMASLLDALEEFRKAGMLQQLSDLLAQMPIINRPQLKAGVLAVGAGLGFRLSTAETALTQADRDAIRSHTDPGWPLETSTCRGRSRAGTVRRSRSSRPT